MPTAPFTRDTECEYGLRLPDGREIWPPETFHGTGFQSVQGREAILKALREGLGNMGQPETALSQYQWLVREVQVLTVRVPLDTTTHDLDDPNLTDAREDMGG